MISSQILQNTIDELHTITRVDFSIMDVEGNEVASTIPTDYISSQAIAQFADSPADSQVVQNAHFFKIYDEKALEYVLISKGSGEDAYMLGRVAVSEIQNLIIAYKERFDRNNFIQNLLLDNMLLIDIYNRAKKLHIETEVRRIVYLIETKYEKDNTAMEIVKGLFSGKTKDFITAVDEKSIILVQELKEGESYEQVDETAKMLRDMLNTEAMSDVKIAYGTIVNEIRQVSRSYKEAKLALDVGKIFYMERSIIAYNTLGIGRLIYQLPLPLCQMFMKEVFTEAKPDSFDEETLTTINKFFENSLNVSETARQLYIHRNTLVYRLEKLQKSTGLDIRVFDDALTFKIAMMVVSYMKYMENQM
ncbi:MAG TPA: helix-turn-helix domain-containing protein [Candidatus Choladousia intestinavium]|uniref:Helix-turn-helix domain-containing protein n=1 Tax=Candidatus Choladousia intestinavium TaxID=2840727 RepID=A0A9D1AD66_9FIRM|nr:helix-turn-helix domain-containing protein [Candidatus Choladousia intestinavium]